MVHAGGPPLLISTVSSRVFNRDGPREIFVKADLLHADWLTRRAARVSIVRTFKIREGPACRPVKKVAKCFLSVKLLFTFEIKNSRIYPAELLSPEIILRFLSPNTPDSFYEI